jgi:glutamine synthetase
MKTSIEYLWTGIDLIQNNIELGLNITRKKFHTKVRTINTKLESPTISDFPIWSFDGSSTGHVVPDILTNANTEIILKPVKFYPHPWGLDWLVLCETFNIDHTPHQTNTRAQVNKIFETNMYLVPRYGLEQEYVFMDSITDTIYGWDHDPTKWIAQTEHYCNTGPLFAKLRPIVQEHYLICLKLGLNISGFNAEVMPSQWEFQIGPSVGINAADELTIGRFILERLAESHNLYINYHSKPLSAYNGSGCHHNFSTSETDILTQSTYMKFYNSKFSQIGSTHAQQLKSYGNDNHLRLSGLHETSSMNVFSYGIGTRHTSIRIPVDVYTYFEDRRPSSSCDPYLSTASLLNAYQG